MTFVRMSTPLTVIPADSIDFLGFKRGAVCSWLDIASSCDLFYDGANAYGGMVSGNIANLSGEFTESMANVLRKSTTAGDTMELSFKYGKEIFSPISINPALISATLTPDRIKVYLTTDVVLSGLPDSLFNSVLTLASNPNAQLIATVNKNQIVNSYPNLHSYK